MSYEVEQKYIVTDLFKIEESLRRMGVDIGPVFTQADIYFSPPGKDFSKTDEAFRIRQVDEFNFLTYKGPNIDNKTKTRLEKEVTLPNGQEYAAQFIELLEILGFQVITSVKKQRRKVSICKHDVVIKTALDQVEQLGEFVELEVIASQSEIETAKQTIASLAEDLELYQCEGLSYCELMLKSMN